MGRPVDMMAEHSKREKKRIEDLEAMGMLWVCQCCDAHLNTDNVGETCPVCGTPADDAE